MDEFIKKLIVHIPEKNFKMVRYYGIYSRRPKEKTNFIKMIEERIVKLKQSFNRWEYRILSTFGVSSCECPQCNRKMKFYDIVYPKYGSIREYLRRKILIEKEKKLEDLIGVYGKEYKG